MTAAPRNREPDRRARRLWDVSSSVVTSGELERADAGSEVSDHARADFRAFYAENHAPVARALAVTLRDTQLGAEAADEAMARCYSKWLAVREYDNPAGWVYRVGLNWARSFRRKAARRLAPDPPAVAELPTVDPEVHDALGELDPRLRAVVVCRFLLDWSTQQTADALRIRPGTVKSRVHRALHLLEAKLYHMRP